MSGLISAVLQPFRLLRPLTQVLPQTNTINSLVKADVFSLTSIRNKVRCYFPRPSEVKRVRRHGWNKRMETANGRKTIMRRILKGRFVLTH